MTKPKPETPNQKIESAISMMLRRIKEKKNPTTGEKDLAIPDDVAVKIIAQAVSWEKVKHHIKDEGSGFDPADL